MRLVDSIRRAAAAGRLVGWLTLGVILAGVRRRLGEDDSEVVGHV